MWLLLLFSLAGLFGDELSFQNEEIKMLQQEFSRRISQTMHLNQDYQEQIFQDALNRLSQVGINQDQYFLYVDRNPKQQMIFVCFFNSQQKKIIQIGYDRVSTGNPKRKGDYFFTPTGIFRNTIAHGGYRALGTKNEQGWRGLGRQGSRVWDFGWQESYKIIKGRKEFIYIRLLLHATDPDAGESRLGRPDSKGCIRISAKLNQFLDHFGIIDKNYENPRHWLLKKDRQPVFAQGEYLIVGDSSP